MGARVARGLVLAVAMLAAGAGPAAAGGTLSPLSAHIQPGVRHVGGPAFAGDAVAYALPNGRDGFAIRLRDATGDRQAQKVVANGGGPLGFWDTEYDTLAASPEAVAFADILITCHDESG